jgi:hypothetical protein
MPNGEDEGMHANQTVAERDTKPPVWDMSQERAFIEKLLNQRFNFILVFFSVVIAGVLNTKVQLHLQIILTLAFVIVFLLSLAIARAQFKLNLIFEILEKDESHPYTIINKRAGSCGSMRRLIGYVIPISCSLLLLIGMVLAFAGCLTVPPAACCSCLAVGQTPTENSGHCGNQKDGDKPDQQVAPAVRQ